MGILVLVFMFKWSETGNAVMLLMYLSFAANFSVLGISPCLQC